MANYPTCPACLHVAPDVCDDCLQNAYETTKDSGLGLWVVRDGALVPGDAFARLVQEDQRVAALATLTEVPAVRDEAPAALGGE